MNSVPLWCKNPDASPRRREGHEGFGYLTAEALRLQRIFQGKKSELRVLCASVVQMHLTILSDRMESKVAAQ